MSLMSLMSMPHTHEVRYRELSYAQKRAIREKLTETFSCEDGIYVEDVTDRSIGRDLDIPWSLIEYVRERDYGHLA